MRGEVNLDGIWLHVPIKLEKKFFDELDLKSFSDKSFREIESTIKYKVRLADLCLRIEIFQITEALKLPNCRNF